MKNSSDFDRIIIKDLRLDMSLGIYDHEKDSLQPVIVNIVIEVSASRDKKPLGIQDVISYEDVVGKLKTLSASRHFDLAEEYVEEIAVLCLKYDKTKSCNISVIKTQILQEAYGVGVEIYRKKA